MRGWAGLLAVLLASIMFISIEPTEQDKQARYWLVFLFMAASPCTVLYNIFGFKKAPDRRIALAALVAAIIMGVLFLVFAGACAFEFFGSFRPNPSP